MLLVIDTCFNACSAALYDDAAGRVIASGYEAMERGHAEALGPMVERLFIDAGLKPGQLSRIAVTHGPGTFTGLRIGLSFAKGMALALDIPLVGIDSLTASAAPHFGSVEKLVVAQQAGGTGLFYWAGFENGKMSSPGLANAVEIDEAVGAEGILLKHSRLDAKDFAALSRCISGHRMQSQVYRLKPHRPRRGLPLIMTLSLWLTSTLQVFPRGGQKQS
jgi:tRNA threonylcarbamoyl adenosine modification protein YeaZ